MSRGQVTAALVDPDRCERIVDRDRTRQLARIAPTHAQLVPVDPTARRGRLVAQTREHGARGEPRLDRERMAVQRRISHAELRDLLARRVPPEQREDVCERAGVEPFRQRERRAHLLPPRGIIEHQLRPR